MIFHFSVQIFHNRAANQISSKCRFPWKNQNWLQLWTWREKLQIQNFVSLGCLTLWKFRSWRQLTMSFSFVLYSGTVDCFVHLWNISLEKWKWKIFCSGFFCLVLPTVMFDSNHIVSFSWSRPVRIDCELRILFRRKFFVSKRIVVNSSPMQMNSNGNSQRNLRVICSAELACSVDDNSSEQLFPFKYKKGRHSKKWLEWVRGWFYSLFILKLFFAPIFFLVLLWNVVRVHFNKILSCMNISVCKFFITEFQTRLDETSKSKSVIETGYSFDEKKRKKKKYKDS